MNPEINPTGGFLIPERMLIDEHRPGRFFAAVRWLGERILRLGAWVRALGYVQREIFPLKALMERIADAKVRQ